jgi:hypothetical protein
MFNVEKANSIVHSFLLIYYTVCYKLRFDKHKNILIHLMEWSLQYVIPTVRYSYSTLFLQYVIPTYVIPTVRYSYSTLFLQYFIPTVRYSYSTLFLQYFIPRHLIVV